ncbi:hypothetical protein MPSEU_000222300 [Mayamaea pseudoterrestris]|nr:hypothetical protein MPSEU_000222300 [Mayamaea pseudoterrestris]
MRCIIVIVWSVVAAAKYKRRLFRWSCQCYRAIKVVILDNERAIWFQGRKGQGDFRVGTSGQRDGRHGGFVRRKGSTMKMLQSTTCLLLLSLLSGAAAFSPAVTPSTFSRVSTRRNAGFAAATTSKKGTKKKQKASTSSPPFDIAASVLRQSEKYDQLLLEAAKIRQLESDDDDDDESAFSSSSSSTNNEPFCSTTEYVVTARDKTRTTVSDWVPIGHLVLASTTATEADEATLKQACVSLYCRELSHLAQTGSRVFAQLPRHNMEYALECIDSFQKHVYERILDNGKNQVEQLSVSDARSILQIDSDTADLDLATIKRQYRKLSFEHHPDRHESLENKETAGAQYAKVQAAYDRLTHSGMVRKSGSSWYESLGGRARTDFGAVSLVSLEEAQKIVAFSQIHRGSAVSGMEPDIVQTFVARSNSASLRS